MPTGRTLECLEAARPLLAPRAAIVITLKNFDGPTWHERCAAAERRLRELCVAGSVRQLHLFSNGQTEVTLTGTYAS